MINRICDVFIQTFQLNDVMMHDLNLQEDIRNLPSPILDSILWTFLHLEDFSGTAASWHKPRLCLYTEYDWSDQEKALLCTLV